MSRRTRTALSALYGVVTLDASEKNKSIVVVYWIRLALFRELLREVQQKHLLCYFQWKQFKYLIQKKFGWGGVVVGWSWGWNIALSPEILRCSKYIRNVNVVYGYLGRYIENNIYIIIGGNRSSSVINLKFSERFVAPKMAVCEAHLLLNFILLTIRTH